MATQACKSDLRGRMKPQRYTARLSQLGWFQQHHLECISGCTEYSKLKYRLKYKISSSWVQNRSFTLNWELIITPPRLILSVNRVMSSPKKKIVLRLPGSVTLNTFWIEDSWKQFKLSIIFEPSEINTLTPLSLSPTQVISTLNAMDKNSES